MIDQHAHTKYSPDSQITIEEYLKKAADFNNEYINITDHFDLFKNIEIIPERKYEFEKIFAEVENKGFTNVKVGIEVGYNKTTEKETIEYLNKFPFSLVLLSVHTDDTNQVRYVFANKSDDEDKIIKLYFQQLIDAVSSNIDFDILTHIDYIFRYVSSSVNPLDYVNLLQPVFKILIEKNKILEFNTSCFRRKNQVLIDYYHNALKLYKLLGGKNIAISSDSHMIDDYCSNFDKAIAMLKELEYEYVVYVYDRIHTKHYL